MLSRQPSSWQRPPALEIPAKTGHPSDLAVPSADGLLVGGSLSPDVQSNCPPAFIPQGLDVTASLPSVLKIGNYVLMERLADMSAGIAVYSAVHVDTSEKFICRVSALCLSRKVASVVCHMAFCCIKFKIITYSVFALVAMSFSDG